MCVCVYMCMCVFVYVCMCVFVYVCMCVFVYVCVLTLLTGRYLRGYSEEGLEAYAWH